MQNYKEELLQKSNKEINKILLQKEGQISEEEFSELKSNLKLYKEQLQTKTLSRTNIRAVVNLLL